MEESSSSWSILLLGVVVSSPPALSRVFLGLTGVFPGDSKAVYLGGVKGPRSLRGGSGVRFIAYEER